MTKTAKLLREIKSSDEDFEWYPTTNEIIEIIKKDMVDEANQSTPSILDCGAGDGRVLNALTEGNKYAIEKSKPLLNALDRSIFVVGTEFEQQTLIDKRVDVVFSNPPYLQFAEWAIKIINEANASVIYLVIPERWNSDERIHDAIKAREGDYEVIGNTDFLDAERAARAKVDILRIDLSNCCRKNQHQYSSRQHYVNVDPFKMWFEDNFKIDIANDSDSKFAFDASSKSNLDEKLSNELVNGNDLITALEALYQTNLANIMQTYKKLGEVDSTLLKELNVEIEQVRKALRLRVEGLKDLYWKELFNNLRKVTDKLTSHSREALLKQLTAHTHIDFTASNAYAVVIWVIKNSNHYFDDQLINMVETMTEKANVVAYKSNKNTFGDENWRYNGYPDHSTLKNFKLDYRIVLARVGGVCDPNSWSSRSTNGLEERATTFIDNMRTIATNIGFDTTNQNGANDLQWSSGKRHDFHFYNQETGKAEILFDVKAFKNGNLHMRMNQKFMCKLNVEFGRLKGWIKSPKEAAEELDIPFEQAVDSFHSNLQLEGSNIMLLDFKKAA